MSCCNTTLDLGCFSACNTVDILTAGSTETFTIKANDGVRTIETTQAVTIGNPIQIDNSSLDYQPGYAYTVNVLDASGDEVTDTVDAIEYDCWKITFENTVT